MRHQLDVYNDLEGKLRSVPTDCDILVMGDLNARMGSEQEYINNENNSNIPIPDSDIYQSDTIATFPRQNTDTVSNDYGKKLLDLCRSVPLRICNGRKLGDLMGNPTCFKYNGLSSVDYGLVSPNFYERVATFSVGNPLLSISDHTPISVTITTNAWCTAEPIKCKFIPKPGKICWDKTKSTRFELLLQTPECKQSVCSFVQSGIESTEEGIHEAVNFVTDTIISKAVAADMSVKRSKAPSKSSNNRKKKVHPKWHDLSCQQALQRLKTTSNLLKKDPKNSWLRGRVNVEQKQYKNIVKKTQNNFLNSMFDQLDNYKNSDPKKYMEIVRSLRNGSHDCAQKDDSSSVPPDEWRDHFSNLLGKPIPQTGDQITRDNFVNEHSPGASIPELDCIITKAELINSIKKLKNKNPPVLIK